MDQSATTDHWYWFIILYGRYDDSETFDHSMGILLSTVFEPSNVFKTPWAEEVFIDPYLMNKLLMYQGF